MKRPLRITLAEIGVLLCCATPVGAAMDYGQAVKNLNPVAYWRLGESTGSVAADASGNAINGAYVGAVTLGQTGALVGDADTAAAFEGGYMYVAHDDRMLLNNGTIQFWLKDTGDGNAEGLFSKDASYFVTGGHLTVRTDTNNNLTVRLQSTDAEYSVTSTTAIALDTWTMATFTFGSGGMKLYINDQLEAVNGYTGGLGTSSGGVGNYEPIAIGANTWASDPGEIDPLTETYSGLLDEVVIYDTELTATQVQTLYTIGSVPEPATLTLLAAGAIAALKRRPKQT